MATEGITFTTDRPNCRATQFSLYHDLALTVPYTGTEVTLVVSAAYDVSLIVNKEQPYNTPLYLKASSESGNSHDVLTLDFEICGYEKVNILENTKIFYLQFSKGFERWTQKEYATAFASNNTRCPV